MPTIVTPLSPLLLPTPEVLTAEQLAEAAQTAEVKELMKRYGHLRALIDTTTGDVHFDRGTIERLEKKDAKLTGFRALYA